jgi:hypothetical protein
VHSQYACSIIAAVLQQCAVTNRFSYFGWQVAITVFAYLAYWLLLLLFVVTLGTMLDKQLGRSMTVSRAARLGAIGFMGVLTCAAMGLTCYINWIQSTRYAYRGGNIYSLLLAQRALRMAYVSLYLAIVVVAGAFMFKTIMTLRTWKSPAGVSYSIEY